MSKDIFFEIHKDLERESPGGNDCTRKAFQMLPKMDSPSILDVGCGPGAATIELSKLSKGHVIGIDTHQPFLDRLMQKIHEAGLSNRVEALNCSMFEMDFPDENFDVIWGEGSIYIIGFERGLKEWRRFIKPRGYLVVNEMTWLKSNPPKEILDFWEECYPAISPISENMKMISSCGYRLIGHFPLPEEAWWKGYYNPLEKRIQGLRKKYKDNPKALELLAEEQREIDLYRKFSSWYGSVFFIMQKTGSKVERRTE